MTYEAIKAELESLTQGLLYMSETEAPIVLTDIATASPEAFAAYCSLPAAGFQQEDGSAFFDKMIRNAAADPDDAVMLQLSGRYETLQQFLLQNLASLQLYRAGAPRSELFICGSTESGKDIVLHTAAVHT